MLVLGCVLFPGLGRENFKESWNWTTASMKSAVLKLECYKQKSLSTKFNDKWWMETNMIELLAALWQTRVVRFKSNLLLSSQMYNMSSLHKYN